MDIVKLDINVQDTEKDGYSVSGTYESGEPFTMTLLGTGENDSDDAVLNFVAGSGKIDYQGTLRNTFTEQ